MRELFQELKRRNVYRVAATYAVVAFVTLQAAKLIFPATTLEGAYDVLVLVAFVGFPIALVIAWACSPRPAQRLGTWWASGATRPPSRATARSPFSPSRCRARPPKPGGTGWSRCSAPGWTERGSSGRSPTAPCSPPGTVGGRGRGRRPAPAPRRRSRWHARWEPGTRWSAPPSSSATSSPSRPTSTPPPRASGSAGSRWRARPTASPRSPTASPDG